MTQELASSPVWPGPLPPDPGPVTLPPQWVPPPLFGAQASLEVPSGLPQRLGEGLHSLNQGNSDYIFCFKTFAYKLLTYFVHYSEITPNSHSHPVGKY